MCCYSSFRYEYTSSVCSNSAQDVSVPPNVHSILRSTNREGFSRRSSIVGPGFITVKPKISHYAYRRGRKNLDEAFCILKVTGVLIEKTLMYIFSKIQLFFKYNHARIQKVMPEAGGPKMAQH